MDVFITLITNTNKGLDLAQIKGLDLITSIECHPACVGLITQILYSLGFRLGLWVSFQFGASFLTRASLTRTSWARPIATRCQFGARQFGARQFGARQFGAFSQFGACQSDARQFDAF